MLGKMAQYADRYLLSALLIYFVFTWFLFPHLDIYPYLEIRKVLNLLFSVTIVGLMLLSPAFLKTQIIYLIGLSVALFVSFLGGESRGELLAQIKHLVGPLIVIFLFAKKDQMKHPSKGLVRSLLILSLASLVVQLAIFGFEANYQFLWSRGQATLAGLDPNYTGLVLLFFLIMSVFAGFGLGQVFVILSSFFVASRGLLLAILMFYFFSLLFKSLRKKSSWLCSRKGRCLLIPGIVGASLLMLFIAGYVFPFLREEIANNPHGLIRKTFHARIWGDSKLFQLLDNSNSVRFEVIRSYLAYLWREPQSLLWGLDNYPSIFPKVLHNSFLDLSARFGFMTPVLIFYGLIKGFRNEWTLYLASAFVSVIVIGSFLANCYEAKTWIFLAILSLMVPSNEPQFQKEQNGFP